MPVLVSEGSYSGRMLPVQQWHSLPVCSLRWTGEISRQEEAGTRETGHIEHNSSAWPWGHNSCSSHSLYAVVLPLYPRCNACQLSDHTHVLLGHSDDTNMARLVVEKTTNILFWVMSVLGVMTTTGLQFPIYIPVSDVCTCLPEKSRDCLQDQQSTFCSVGNVSLNLVVSGPWWSTRTMSALLRDEFGSSADWWLFSLQEAEKRLRNLTKDWHADRDAWLTVLKGRVAVVQLGIRTLVLHQKRRCMVTHVVFFYKLL